MFVNVIKRCCQFHRNKSLDIFRSDRIKGFPWAATQVATLMKLNEPLNFDHVEYPARRKLPIFQRVPNMPMHQRPPKMFKDLYNMRGPERIHNKIQYGEFGVQALTGGQLRWGHLEGVRLTINRKIDESRMFAIWRVGQPWKAISKKGSGKRMGSGKGPIDHYTFPIRANRLIVELGGECELREIKPILRHVISILPFKARIVTKEILEEDAEKEKYERENNINPFTFKYCAKNNMLGCKNWMSPYDFEWHGKYR